jgi:hypothetical protein
MNALERAVSLRDSLDPPLGAKSYRVFKYSTNSRFCASLSFKA